MQLAIALGGALLGNAMGWSILGLTGAQVGWMAGSIVGQLLFPTSGPDVQGPRLSDLKVQTSTYGSMIPIVYGSYRLAGNVIWSTDLIETVHEEESKGGGSTYTTYTYAVSCAIGICEGPVTEVRRIWANGELIYDPSTHPAGITVYLGTEDQTPNSLMESYLGAGNVPAHRGMVYVVLDNFQLQKYGNRIPNFSVEVARSPWVATNIPILPDDGWYGSNGLAYCAANNRLYWASDYGYTLVNPSTNMWVKNVTMPSPPLWSPIIDDPVGGWVWAYEGAPGVSLLYRINPDDDTYTSYNMGQVIWGLWYDPGNGDVWVQLNGNTHGSIMRKINKDDPTGTSLRDVVDADGFFWVAFDADHALWSIPLYNVDASLRKVDVADNYTTHPTGAAYGLGMLYYMPDKNGFVVQDGGYSVGELMIFDIATNSVTQKIAMNLWGDPSVYETSTGNFYYFDNWNQKFYIIPTASIGSYTVLDLNAVGAPWGIYEGVHIDGAGNLWLVNADVLSLVKITRAPGVSLAEIVRDLCLRTKLTDDDINVAQLTDTVIGYAVGRQMSARVAIEGLQSAYYFDAVESA